MGDVNEIRFVAGLLWSVAVDLARTGCFTSKTKWSRFDSEELTAVNPAREAAGYSIRSARIFLF